MINKISQKGRYKKGRVLEEKAKKELMEAGYYPIRSAGSKGLFDIIGISSVDIILIQVKSNRRASAKEVSLIKKFPCAENVKKSIWVWHDRKGFIKEYYS